MESERSNLTPPDAKVIGGYEILRPLASGGMGDVTSQPEFDPPLNAGIETMLPRHEVTISSAFYLGTHEVPVGQFKAFVDDLGYQTDEERGVGRKVRRDGGLLAVNVSVSRLHTSPSPLALVSVRDISKRKILEDELKETQIQLRDALAEKTSRLNETSDELKQSTQRLRELLDDIDAIVWEANLPCLDFTFVSKQAETILGYAVEQWLAEDDFWIRHIHRDDAEMSLNACQDAAEKGHDHALQYRMIALDGAVVWMQDIVHVVKNDVGDPIKLRGVMVDVTERIDAEQRKEQLNLELRKSERQLAHVARLSTMGEMVAGISHEINQPLSAIANFANAAIQTLERSEIEIDAPLIQWMNQISDQAIRCGDIIRRLRGFARRTDFEDSIVNVRESINNAEAILGDLLQEHAIDFEVDVVDDYWIRINDVEFQQVLVNLARNACEAVAESDSSDPKIRIDASKHEHTINILFEDNGPGIDADVNESVFDAFFTTRSEGMGMGLGISRSIIQSHGGQLTLDETYQNGARFCIAIPLIHERELGECG